jgi:hypothetical protein
VKRLELLLATCILAALAVAIVFARPRPPDTSLFGAGPALAPALSPLALPAPALTLNGRVLSAAGAPLEDAFVVLLPADGADPAQPPLHNAYTDAAGGFEFTHLAAGTVRVVLSHPSAPPRTFAFELPAAGAVEWRLAEPLPPLESLPPLERTELTGLLRAGEGGLGTPADLAGFELWLVPAATTPLLSGASERRTTSDASGHFAFPELVTGSYEARALPPWARGGTWPVLGRAALDVRTGTPNALGIALEVGSLAGRAAEAGGRALPGAVVSVAALDALDPAGKPALWPPVVADQDGTFRVELLPPGRYAVHVRAGAAQADLEVAVASGQITAVPLAPLDPRSEPPRPRQ